MDKTRNKKDDVITWALDTLQINDKNQLIMVGDRMHDVIGARENDIKVIGVLYGYGEVNTHYRTQKTATVLLYSRRFVKVIISHQISFSPSV